MSERKIDQEYQKFKRKQSQVYSICEKKKQETKEQDYLSLKGSRSVSDLSNEERNLSPTCKTNRKKYSTTPLFKRD